jgi:hypothetical protein
MKSGTQVKSMNRLLLLSCSRSKRADSDLLPAFERYNGPAFRLLRRYMKSSTNAPIVKILSAEFGVIPHDCYIPNYNRSMTVQRARELQPKVLEEINKTLKAVNSKKSQEVFICLGKNYMKTLEGSSIFSSQAKVKVALGTPGKRLFDLYNWLYGEAPKQRQYSCSEKAKVCVRIRGMDIKATPEEVLNTARRAVESGFKEKDCSHSWFVVVDEKRVSPKWLVSLISGLPVSSFHTDEARRVLTQIGVQVHAA